jgi:hypothetical protein
LQSHIPTVLKTRSAYPLWTIFAFYLSDCESARLQAIRHSPTWADT